MKYELSYIQIKLCRGEYREFCPVCGTIFPRIRKNKTKFCDMTCASVWKSYRYSHRQIKPKRTGKFRPWTSHDYTYLLEYAHEGHKKIAKDNYRDPEDVRIALTRVFAIGREGIIRMRAIEDNNKEISCKPRYHKKKIEEAIYED